MAGRLAVHIRARDSNSDSIWKYDGNLLSYYKNGKWIQIDGFSSILFNTNNEELFCKNIKDAVHRLNNGLNSAVFAYGQTGSGKTYTILGNAKNGLVHLALKEILPKKLSISYFQIYNERLYDMFTTEELSIFVDNCRTHVANLYIQEVRTEDEAHTFLEQCELNRRVSATERNASSSRSHAIIQMYFNGGSLYFIDLAGSEKSTGSDEQKKEGACINRSLLSFGKAVRNMVAGRFIGFRESKLTRILQPLMCADTNLIALCMISTDRTSLEESLSTLSFAASLGQIKLKSAKIEFEKQNNHNENKEIERLKELRELYENRIASLEKTVQNLLSMSPNKLISEIFVLEKQMFNMQIEMDKESETIN